MFRKAGSLWRLFAKAVMLEAESTMNIAEKQSRHS
jgi:hypothetical protein